MFQTVNGFLTLWTFEADTTQKILNQLTDKSLSQEVTSHNWTLGRIAWHIVTAIGVIASQTGLSFDVHIEDYPVPTSAKFIADSYKQASSALVQALKNQWTDKNLGEVREFFSQRMSNSELLFFIIQPSNSPSRTNDNSNASSRSNHTWRLRTGKEEWAKIGMDAPKM